MKQCDQCLSLLPEEMFHKNARFRDGREKLCANCEPPETFIERHEEKRRREAEIERSLRPEPVVKRVRKNKQGLSEIAIKLHGGDVREGLEVHGWWYERTTKRSSLPSCISMAG